MNKKNFIIVDPKTDSLMLQLFNDISLDGQAIYDYAGKPEKWIKASSKIGRRAKPLIKRKEPLLYPPSSSRTNQLGFILMPKKVTCEKHPFGNKTKFVFNRKLF